MGNWGVDGRPTGACPSILIPSAYRLRRRLHLFNLKLSPTIFPQRLTSNRPVEFIVRSYSLLLCLVLRKIKFASKCPSLVCLFFGLFLPPTSLHWSLFPRHQEPTNAFLHAERTRTNRKTRWRLYLAPYPLWGTLHQSSLVPVRDHLQYSRSLLHLRRHLVL